MIFCLEAMAFLRGGSPRDTLSALDSPPGTWPLSLSAGLAQPLPEAREAVPEARGRGSDFGFGNAIERP